MFWLLLTLWVLILGTAAGFLLKKIVPAVGWTILALMLLFLVTVAVGAGICWDAPENDPAPEADYGLLLGCALHDGQATGELIRRCEEALAWMEENPGKYLVLSGGDPGNQGRTEAAVMAAWLRNHGADAGRLITEDRAADTRQNLLFSKALMQEKNVETDTVAVITSEYHQTRARFLAGKNGQQTICVSCRTPGPSRLVCAVREVYSFVKAIVAQPVVNCTSYVAEG